MTITKKLGFFFVITASVFFAIAGGINFGTYGACVAIGISALVLAALFFAA